MTFVVNKAGTDAMTTNKDPAYSTPNRTAASNTAVMALTPQYVGEIVATLDNGLSFMGYALSAGAWQQLYPKQ